MSVKVAAEKNFRRSKVKPVKKTERARIFWRALRVVLPAALAIFAAYRACDLVLTAATLQIRRIGVHGNERLSAGEVQALVDGLQGTNILSADLPGYRARLMLSPWVADVALRRVLPSTIEVFISERRPIGLCRLGDQLYLLDRTASIIDEYGPAYADLDLPIIDGVVRPPAGRPRSTAKGAGAQWVGEPVIDQQRTELAARVIEALAPHKALAERVSQIDVSDRHDAVVLLEQDPALLHLGDEQFSQRLQSYVDLAPTLRSHVPEIDYVDLRFDNRVYLRPVGDTARQDAGSVAERSPNPVAAPSALRVTPRAKAGGVRRGGKARPVKPGRRR
ncbi:MAG: FtsQ-type POTRA domain-containing protein [Vicinamibacterales bacterium]